MKIGRRSGGMGLGRSLGCTAGFGGNAFATTNTWTFFVTATPAATATATTRSIDVCWKQWKELMSVNDDVMSKA